MERALSFGSVARAYERYRLGYPQAVADEVLAYAGRPVRRALEIGAGTGKATRIFAARGIAVTATDPDPAMLGELRRHVPDSVVTVRAAFEDLPLEPVHDLVYAAASLHWTDALTRWHRVAGMLRAGGVVASFGGPAWLADPAVEAAVRTARSPYVEDDEVPPPDGTPADAPLRWPGTELEEDARFTDVRQTILSRRLLVPADDYVGQLGTVSAYVVLPDADQELVLARVREVLPDPVEVVADIFVHLARLA